MSNKHTFIYPNSSSTSRIKNELQYEYSIGKLFCWAATINLPWLHKFRYLSPTLGLFRDLSLTLAEFPDISSSPEITENWEPRRKQHVVEFLKNRQQQK